jgi:EAL domain-containing protein (putative c-di-GMP-specific phosphodiesterase class I)
MMAEPDETLDWPGWTWHRDSGQLSIATAARRDLAPLEGDWSLDALRHLIDGLSSARMAMAFRDAETPGVGDIINCAVALQNGKRVQFVGGYTGPDVAQGIILADSSGAERPVAEAETDEPGAALEPHFQPIFEAASGRIAGFEALARWQGGRAVDPRHFEGDGLLQNMLLHAGELARDMKQSCPGETPFVAVNLTARDLAHPGLADLVGGVISSHGLAPGALIAELTEHDALRDTAAARDRAEALDAAGAALVLDDFGAGQSSFLWLVDLPVTALKLDGELIAKRKTLKGEAVIASLVGLARTLGLSTTAEGVEEGGEAERLAALGIDRIQGFALARPMPASAALALARR